MRTVLRVNRQNLQPVHADKKLCKLTKQNKNKTGLKQWQRDFLSTLHMGNSSERNKVCLTERSIICLPLMSAFDVMLPGSLLVYVFISSKVSSVGQLTSCAVCCYLKTPDPRDPEGTAWQENHHSIGRGSG